MGRTPDIIPLSEFRRDAAKLIFKAFRTHQPLFITQRGYVTAVLLSREEYDVMCALRDKGIKALSPRAYIDDQAPRACDVEDRPKYSDDW